jgi:hypothetical protein
MMITPGQDGSAKDDVALDAEGVTIGDSPTEDAEASQGSSPVPPPSSGGSGGLAPPGLGGEDGRGRA